MMTLQSDSEGEPFQIPRLPVGEGYPYGWPPPQAPGAQSTGVATAPGAAASSGQVAQPPPPDHPPPDF
eukprot:3380439-Pyramimonas_sp.AAC.1